MRHRCCNIVLIVNEDPHVLDVTGDALRAQGVIVLLAPALGDAVRALRSGFTPDVILLDAPVAEAMESMRALDAEPGWRAIPVLGVSEQTASIVQMAPHQRQRSLPVPADAAEMRELLERVCSEGDGLRP